MVGSHIKMISFDHGYVQVIRYSRSYENACHWRDYDFGKRNLSDRIRIGARLLRAIRAVSQYPESFTNEALHKTGESIHSFQFWPMPK